MLSINKMYIVEGRHVDILSPTDSTPYQLQAELNQNTKILVGMYSTVHEKTLVLDYGRLITDTDMGKHATWDAFISHLTDAHLMGYDSEVPGFIAGTHNPSHPVETWDVLGTLKTFDCGYGDYLSGKKDLAHFKAHLPDLYVSLQPNATAAPNLKNCLPICNGFGCRPLYVESTQTLWALRGLTLCEQSNERSTPEFLLLDFNNIGETSVHSIRFTPRQTSDFILSFNNDDNSPDLNVDWTLQSPEHISLFEYTPILSIGGVIFFPDQYTILSERKLRFTPTTVPLDLAMAYRYYLYNNPDSRAEVSYTSKSILEHLSDAVDESYPSDTFVFLVKTSTLYINRTPLDVWENSIIIHLYTVAGILLQDKTSTIRAYHIERNTDVSTLTIQNMSELYSTDQPYEDKQYTMVRPDCQHHDFKNIYRSNCTMLLLTK